MPLQCACAGAVCTGTQSVTLGAAVTISDGPHSYVDNAACRWAVTATGPISLFVRSFETEEEYDTVTIFAGEDGSQSLLYTLSGVLGPTLLATNATSVTIEFAADVDLHFAGFVIELSTVQPGGTWAPSQAPSVAPTWPPGSGALRLALLRLVAPGTVADRFAAVGRNRHCGRPGRLYHVRVRRRQVRAVHRGHARVVVRRALPCGCHSVPHDASSSRAHWHNPGGDWRPELRAAANLRVRTRPRLRTAPIRCDPNVNA
jgi:hypothetical protein